MTAAPRTDLDVGDRLVAARVERVRAALLSTLATVKRETGGWTMPLAMAAYLFALAYAAAFVTYRVALLVT